MKQQQQQQQLKRRREEEEEEEEEIEADFNLLTIDKGKIVHEMLMIKKKYYQKIIKTIYTLTWMVVMIVAICNLNRCHIFYGCVFMMGFAALEFKRYGLSLVYRALRCNSYDDDNNNHNKKQY